MKPLVLCADDFALHAPVSRGIAALAAQGRLTATSVMVLSPRWPQDVALLHELRGHLDVGLHLDWTSGFAMAAGHGLGLGAAMRRAVLGGFDPQAARIVIERQLDAFEAHWQAPPDHIDGHQHVQQFAGIRQALLQAVARRYPQRPPWLRISRAPAGQRSLKSRVIAALGAGALAQQARQAGVPVAGALSGIYDFAGGETVYAQHMARWLQASPAGTLLMCHPADRIAPDDAIGAARLWEFDLLRSADFAQLLSSARVRLVRGSTLYTALRDAS
jgi:predicted glycoside hydrolase/deacetylase ChbG (UPF0249 family)